MSAFRPHEIIAMTREAIEVPSDNWYRKYEPGPVTLWVEGRPVGYLTAEQQLAVRDVLASGAVPPDLDAWVRSLGPIAGESWGSLSISVSPPPRIAWPNSSAMTVTT